MCDSVIVCVCHQASAACLIVNVFPPPDPRRSAERRTSPIPLRHDLSLIASPIRRNAASETPKLSWQSLSGEGGERFLCAGVRVDGKRSANGATQRDVVLTQRVVRPDELILMIFSFLKPSDLAACARVARHWSRLAADASLWRTISAQSYRSVSTPCARSAEHTSRC